jgi:hypothetical protein
VLLPLQRVLIPVVASVNWVTNGLLRLLGVNPVSNGEERVSREELRTIVSDPGAMIPQRHRGMLVNILDLENVTVDDIMVPRNEFYGIDLDDDDDTILRRIRDSTHTLLPVWRERQQQHRGRAAPAQPESRHQRGGSEPRRAPVTAWTSPTSFPRAPPCTRSCAISSRRSCAWVSSSTSTAT